jgi:hypothetical protein
MPKANIPGCSMLEEVYPSDAFAGDARQNSRVPNAVLNGVRILLCRNDAANGHTGRRSMSAPPIGTAAALTVLLIGKAAPPFNERGFE